MQGSDAGPVGRVLRWPVERRSRSFRIYVVEPASYDPNWHEPLFKRVLTELISPKLAADRGGRSTSNMPITDRFDLVTFPEAFLPASGLVTTLSDLSGFDGLGCVHVGLRPNDNDGTHLFTVAEFKSLLDRLRAIQSLHKPDIAPVSKWLDGQPDDRNFNVGCLFAIDHRARIRVCIHPKMVRSKFEVSITAEKRMTEADFLTLVTLVPTDKQYLSVTLQPMLCSDALQLQTDRPGQNPFDCVNNRADCFQQPLPDHIDVISVATCTPQRERPCKGPMICREWAGEFLSTFQTIGLGPHWQRHGHATVVLSNFLVLRPGVYSAPQATMGGLSGAFIPVPCGFGDPGTAVHISSWGQPKGLAANNSWSEPSQHQDPNWSSLGYVAQLNPLTTGAPLVKMLGFTISDFPRDHTRWKSPQGLVDFHVLVATPASTPTNLEFEKWKH